VRRVTVGLARADRALLRALLEGVTLADVEIVQAGRVPSLYSARVRYRREHPGSTFDTADIVAARRWGDCGDLAAWRAAELRATGEDPRAFVDLLRTGPHSYHAVVVRDGGQHVEVPSRVLGMGARR
jgi:hypothetical protein